MMESRRNRKKPPSSIKKYMSSPKGLVFVLLIVYAILAVLVNSHDVMGLINALVGVVTALILDGIAGLRFSRKKLFSDGGVVTGLIVAMVLSSATPWYIVSATTAVAILSKHILKIGRKPIFNPAALGLLVAVYAFGSMQSWWGGLSLLSAWWIIPLVVGGLMITNRVRKIAQVASFLGVYFILFFILSMLHVPFASDAFISPFVNSALFLAFFMLTDPPTSPVKAGDQVVFGVIAAIVTVVIYAAFGGLAYLLIGAMTGNVYKAVKSGWNDRQMKLKNKKRQKLHLASLNSHQ